jgi:hemerythrin
MFNDLITACSSGKGSAELEKSLGFLVDYTVKHFADEESWQSSVNYPEYQKHRQIHNDFKAKVTGLVAQFKKDGPTPVILVTLNSAVGEWLINHIRQEDAKIGSFVKSRKLHER